jgi:hypothetical protein
VATQVVLRRSEAVEDTRVVLEGLSMDAVELAKVFVGRILVVSEDTPLSLQLAVFDKPHMTDAD